MLRPFGATSTYWLAGLQDRVGVDGRLANKVTRKTPCYASESPAGAGPFW
jgi:hypothetical protein